MELGGVPSELLSFPFGPSFAIQLKAGVHESGARSGQLRVHRSAFVLDFGEGWAPLASIGVSDSLPGVGGCFARCVSAYVARRVAEGASPEACVVATCVPVCCKLSLYRG
jgi:hypothetical protein